MLEWTETQYTQPHSKTNVLNISGKRGKFVVYKLSKVQMHRNESCVGVRAHSSDISGDMFPTQDFMPAQSAEMAENLTVADREEREHFARNPRTPQIFFNTTDMDELVTIAKLWCENNFADFLRDLDIK